MSKPIVIIESPFAAECEVLRILNKNYAYVCAYDSLIRGEVPLLSHLLYPQFLNDFDEEDRELGISCCIEWQRIADKHVAYTDLGISRGMRQAMREWERPEAPDPVRPGTYVKTRETERRSFGVKFFELVGGYTQCLSTTQVKIVHKRLIDQIPSSHWLDEMTGSTTD